MSNFLPDEYEVPQKSGSYARFVEGENRFRILASPILGYENWVTDGAGNRKPVRYRMDSVPMDIEEPEKVKHFWCMPIYNYNENKVQILEITQKGIQKSLRALAKDEDWGSPLGYDIVVTRTGKDLDTEYQVQPKPAKPLSKEIVEAYNAITINLEALYDGKDPFEKEEAIV